MKKYNIIIEDLHIILFGDNHSVIEDNHLIILDNHELKGCFALTKITGLFIEEV